MNILRKIRVGMATVIALITAVSIFISGCVTKVKEKQNHNEKSRLVPGAIVDMMAPIAPNNILFEKGKSALSPLAIAELEKILAEMKVHKQDTVTIVGHASEEGSAEYNMQLGEQRALKTKAFLVEHGIDAGRIMTVSKGESEPAVPPDTENDRKLNRRVTFMYKTIGN